MDGYWKDLIESLYSPESWLKVLILLGLLPFWWPTVKVMGREFLDSLNMEETRKMAPGENPFLNVPLSAKRRVGDGQGSGKELTPHAPGAPRSAGSKARPAPGARRRTGFAPTRR